MDAAAAVLFLALAGIFGHDPWKPDEGYVVGVVQSMLEDGHWLVPTIAGVPYLDASPLYYWVKARFAGLLRPVMPLADGMRLATPLFMALALWLAGLAGRDLIGYRHGRSTAMLLLGALGLMLFGHSASPDVASSAMALALWALSRARTQGWLAGALLGLALARWPAVERGRCWPGLAGGAAAAGVPGLAHAGTRQDLGGRADRRPAAGAGVAAGPGAVVTALVRFLAAPAGAGRVP